MSEIVNEAAALTEMQGEVVEAMKEAVADFKRRLSLNDIEAADDLDTREVEVPEWGGTVLIQSMTKSVQQQLRRESRVGDDTDNERLEMLMVAYSTIDPHIPADRLEVLRGKSARAVERIVKAILDLNGMTPEEQKAAEATFPQG